MSWQLMFFSGRKLGQYGDLELLKSLFQNKTPDLSFKYPSAWSAGSAVRIKENRPKGKIVLKNREQTEKEKKNGKKKNRKQRHRESNPVHLHVQASPWPLHYIDTNDLYPDSLYRAACLQISNEFFCSVNHLSGSGVNANHNATHSPWLARKNKIENDIKLLKNS